MPNPVKPIPDGFHTVTPYLIIRNAAAALDFYQRAFGAVELYRLAMPDGKIGHALMKIGDSMVMLADESPTMGARGPETIGGSAVCLCLYVPDVDALTAQAEAAGAKILRPLANQFYGERSCYLADPFGHLWNLATHIEDVSSEEITRRAAAVPGAKPEAATQ